ncbi:MAG TPA: HNH endonuclease [Lapillicoccus sp.]|nr:HNH endonuclease [Lapillicoccus sp.]
MTDLEAATLPDRIGEAFALLGLTEDSASDAADLIPAAEQARWAAVEASFHDQPVSTLAGDWVAEELRVIEAVEVVKAWADARGLAALRRLHEAVGMVVQENADWMAQSDGDIASFATVQGETMTASVDEVALATGLPEGRVADRLTLALDEEQRATPLLDALSRGEVTLARALRIQHATRELDPEVARAVALRLLARNSDGSVRSHRSFTRELRRQVAVHTPDPRAARAEALSQRCAYGWLEADGTGRLTVTGDGARITAALDRVDGLARHLRAAGDQRTLAQLRSDVALDLLLYGWADAESGAGTFVSQAPPARVNLVVGLTTLLGLDEQPGEIPGHGFVPAAMARNIALSAGSVWRRLVTDPLDGTALELSTGRYRPTAQMAEQVAALDAMCQAPGCTVPADRCDIDHQRPWPQGETEVRNLRLRHRRHHNHKTRGTWRTESTADGGTQWVTVGGREYLTQRYVYEDPLTTPVSADEIQAADQVAPPF